MTGKGPFISSDLIFPEKMHFGSLDITLVYFLSVSADWPSFLSFLLLLFFLDPSLLRAPFIFKGKI